MSEKINNYEKLEDGLYANFNTSKGNMLIKFYDKESPVTVANFIGLAEGKIKNTAKELGTPFYNGIIFHRVIKDFMIQTGDPNGNGMGGPGYKFDDELNDLKHTELGILSMANSGTNSNGSQFFITEVPTPWLDGKHTIFGKVIQGKEVVVDISSVEVSLNDDPKEKIYINNIDIIRKGKEYDNYDGAEFFKKNKDLISANNAEFLKLKQKKILENIENIKKEMQSTPSGLFYKIEKSTSSKKPVKGSLVSVHYEGTFLDGKVFDSSFSRNSPITFKLGKGMVIPGWDEGIALIGIGEKAKFLIPPELAYGSQGAGGVIPPNSWLIFNVELINIE